MTTMGGKLDNILINLKVLSKINVNDRPIFFGELIKIRYYYPWITPIIRTVAGESRDDIIYGLKDLQNNIDRLYLDLINEIEFVQTTNSSPTSILLDKNHIANCIMQLARIKLEIPKIYELDRKGLNALMVTYENTPETTSQIENIISNFQIFYRKIENKIDELSAKYKVSINLE